MTDWVVCPECDLPAEILDRQTWDSTDGPVGHVHVWCVGGHRFLMPVDSVRPELKGDSWTAPRSPS